MASAKDLREFIIALEKIGELKRVKPQVDPILEISAITDKVSKSYVPACGVAATGGQALLFEDVKGSNLPVLTNAFGSFKRTALALGVESFDEIAERIKGLLKPQLPDSFQDKLSSLGKLVEAASAMPKVVNDGPCQEVVEKDNIDLLKFPILKCWPNDGGRFITLPLVVTKDPQTRSRNVGMYRMQVYDSKTTGMHWHVHKDAARHYKKYAALNKRMEVAVAIGSEPVATYAATAPLPPDVDEFIFAGFIRKSPVQLVKCKTVDIEVPATSEIVLEGYVEPNELRAEGPFGDHTGYYSLQDQYPVFHVTCITHRKNPIYQATVVGRPPMEDCYLAKATERIFLPLIQLMRPDIVDMNLPFEGVFHNFAIVSIDKRYPAQAKEVASSLWGMGQMRFSKMILVMDGDVDVQNISEVTWRALNNVDPKRDIFFSEGPVDVLDHSSNTPLYGSKIGIDATKKLKGEGYLREWPDELKFPKEIIGLINKRWKEYGLDHA